MLKHLNDDEKDIFNKNYIKIDMEYNKQLKTINRLVLEELKECYDMVGKWSIDFLFDGTTFWFIDMAVAGNSYYFDKIKET